MKKAICLIKENKISGSITFIQKQKETEINIYVKGLPPGKHGIHIHEYGDMRNGCETMGAHFNPFKKNHGDYRDKDRHVGDLGNLIADQNGTAKLIIKDKLIKLNGKNSVIGRGLVIHADEDDLGRGMQSDSKTTGHSGARIACGIIALMNDKL